MKIPFDIKYRPEIESGKYKVQTIDGCNVRIICWDAKNASYDDIIALVEENAGEKVIRYYSNGKCTSDGSSKRNKDLVLIIDEPEYPLTPEECVGCTRYLDGYIKGQADSKKGYQEGFWDGYKAGQQTFHYSNFNDCAHGGPCTNPHFDCVNCPRKYLSSGTTTNKSYENTR